MPLLFGRENYKPLYERINNFERGITMTGTMLVGIVGLLLYVAASL